MITRSVLTSLLLASALAGCAPDARERYGGEARYAPSVHGYVVGEGHAAALLRDPLTQSKIRCRERLEEVAPALARALEDRAGDQRSATAARAALLPISLPGFALMHTGIGLLTLSTAPSLAVASRSRRSLYVDASRAFVARDYPRAASLYEEALVQRYDAFMEVSSSPRLHDMILYYLAASHERGGDRAAAREAYQAFLEHGAWENEDAYRDAESGLARLGAPLAPCRSQEPLAMPWKEASR